MNRMQSLFTAGAAVLSTFLGVDATADTRTISGELTYMERIAMPPGADIAVEVRDGNGVVVATVREPVGDRQVPLHFSVEAPLGTLSLRAALFAGTAPAWVSDTIGIEEGAEDVALGTLRLMQFRPLGFATTFACGETTVEIGFHEQMARLRIGATYFDLEASPAASGARFEAPGDPGNWIWSKGNEVTVSIRGAELPRCIPAVEGNLRPFRARGNEPGWTLVISDGAAAFTRQDGGASQGRLSPAETSSRTRRYVVEDADIVVTIENRVARDTMTGMPFPVGVTVETGGIVLTGTGGDPARLLEGVTWRAEDVAGKGIPDGALVTIEFRDGRVAGRSGCNRFMGSYRITGEGFTVGPVGVTQMACPEALMRLERDFLDVLAGTTRFDFDETGALVLYRGDERTALLRH